MGGRLLQMSLVKVSSCPTHCFLFTVLVERGLRDLLWAQFYVILNKEPIYPYDKPFCLSLRIPASGINGKNRTVFCHLFKRMKLLGSFWLSSIFLVERKQKNTVRVVRSEQIAVIIRLICYFTAWTFSEILAVRRQKRMVYSHKGIVNTNKRQTNKKTQHILSLRAADLII